MKVDSVAMQRKGGQEMFMPGEQRVPRVASYMVDG